MGLHWEFMLGKARVHDVIVYDSTCRACPFQVVLPFFGINHVFDANSRYGKVKHLYV